MELTEPTALVCCPGSLPAPSFVCRGLVKPDIVFFGEALPERFHTVSDNPTPSHHHHLRTCSAPRISSQDDSLLLSCGSFALPRLTLFIMASIGLVAAVLLIANMHVLAAQQHVAADMCEADLLIVLGTSLQVQPFASLIGPLQMASSPNICCLRDAYCASLCAK